MAEINITEIHLNSFESNPTYRICNLIKEYNDFLYKQLTRTNYLILKNLEKKIYLEKERLKQQGILLGTNVVYYMNVYDFSQIPKEWYL